MAEMDQGIKRLLQAHPEDVLRLAFPGIEYLEPLAPEVASAPRLELDTLFRARFEGVECAVNIEAQAYSDPTMPRRMFLYGARASDMQHMPTLSVVLWLQRRGSIPTSPYEMRVGSWLQATWQFVSVEVYALEASAIVATGALGLLPLVPFMQNASLEIIAEAGQRIREREASPLATSLIALLGVFMARIYGRDAAYALYRSLAMSTEILEESPLYREWIEQATAQGIAQGAAQGALAALRESARLVLEGRFGSLNTELLAALDRANDTTLRAALPLLGAQGLEQIQTWLIANTRDEQS